MRDRGRGKGLLFGSAVQQNQLARDPGFAETVRREAAIVTPEFELKWAAVRPTPSEDRFAEPDRLLEWCDAQGLRNARPCSGLARGAAALGAALPRRARRTPAVTEHVTKLVRRYAGRLHSWDVVNEAIEPKHGRSDGLRVSVWQAALGPEFIDLAFHTAAAADPSAALYYNEYGLDFDTPEDEARRRATLALLERLRGRGVPIHGLGIQGHLAGAGKPFNAGRFNGFLDQVAALGYRILITELDVTDNKLPADIAARDAAVAALTADYLAVACAHPAGRRRADLGPERPPDLAQQLSRLQTFGRAAAAAAAARCGATAQTDVGRDRAPRSIARPITASPAAEAAPQSRPGRTRPSRARRWCAPRAPRRPDSTPRIGRRGTTARPRRRPRASRAEYHRLGGPDRRRAGAPAPRSRAHRAPAGSRSPNRSAAPARRTTPRRPAR
ncbi:MAG: endo-1,4-beta-xylanase [Pseudomonadota bacterium]